VRKAKANLLRYLRGLHDWIARGLPECDYAAAQGVSSGTSTSRKQSLGLYAERAVGLLDMATGRPLPELLESGEIIAAAEKEPVPA
jgi:hypothetical protein